MLTQNISFVANQTATIPVMTFNELVSRWSDTLEAYVQDKLNKHIIVDILQHGLFHKLENFDDVGDWNKSTYLSDARETMRLPEVFLVRPDEPDRASSSLETSWLISADNAIPVTSRHFDIKPVGLNETGSH